MSSTLLTRYLNTLTDVKPVTSAGLPCLFPRMTTPIKLPSVKKTGEPLNPPESDIPLSVSVILAKYVKPTLLVILPWRTLKEP